MFAKKTEPLPPYTLQALTTEYLIEGTVAGDAILSFPEEGLVGEPIPIGSARIQAVGSAHLPELTWAEFVVLPGNAVALIPRTDHTQLPQYGLWKPYTKPLPGEFYLGPYVMQGQLMMRTAGNLDMEMPILDVRITGQDPAAAWGEIGAPFALLNMRWLHGFRVR